MAIKNNHHDRQLSSQKTWMKKHNFTFWKSTHTLHFWKIYQNSQEDNNGQIIPYKYQSYSSHHTPPKWEWNSLCREGKNIDIIIFGFCTYKKRGRKRNQPTRKLRVGKELVFKLLELTQNCIFILQKFNHKYPNINCCMGRGAW